MAEGSANQEVTCVHCGKPFRPEVLSPESDQAGMKCPHCKLFMPLERVEENDADDLGAAATLNHPQGARPLEAS